MVDLPNGISNANGLLSFNGTEAVIQNLTGETGGGKVSIFGFAGYGGPEMTVRVQASVDGVHVAYPPTVTTQRRQRYRWPAPRRAACSPARSQFRT